MLQSCPTGHQGRTFPSNRRKCKTLSRYTGHTGHNTQETTEDGHDVVKKQTGEKQEIQCDATKHAHNLTETHVETHTETSRDRDTEQTGTAAVQSLILHLIQWAPFIPSSTLAADQGDALGGLLFPLCCKQVCSAAVTTAIDSMGGDDKAYSCLDSGSGGLSGCFHVRRTSTCIKRIFLPVLSRGLGVLSAQQTSPMVVT